jgi:subtilase family serine protease
MANDRDPSVPSALSKVVGGVVYLNSFRPTAYNIHKTKPHVDPKSGTMRPDYTPGNGTLPLVPWDLEKIYNIAPLYSAGISGQGMKIMVVEDTNQWNCTSPNVASASSGSPTHCSPTTSDWAVFRNTFGLGKYPTGAFYQDNPGTTTVNTCTTPGTDPGYPAGSGINGDDVEATIDAEWASAGAPSATIISAACSDPRGGFGGLTAIQNTLNHTGADGIDVISMSYGESEESTGATLNASFNTTFQAAVAAGIGIFVSSGDELAASSDGGGSACSGLPAGDSGDCAKDGITISGWMSSQYDVSVGGLDFADTALGENATYWSANNNVFYGSAKSYIMEQPWNDSCAGTVLAEYLTASPISYGTSGFCNSAFAEANGLELAVGGSGGPSACATGTASTRGVDTGTCAGYAKPSFQSSYIGTMPGLQNDGVRDTPDVALMAANGLWGHYYLICFSDTTTEGTEQGGTACTGEPVNWPGYGGTSVSSPIMASIQALVVQHVGSRQGNPNPRYYAMANTEYSNPTSLAACNSARGNNVAGACAFYDVTIGDIDGNCQAHSGGTKYNCYLPSGIVGALSVSSSSFQMAYPTTSGWDFGSGIGSVNAYNLVMDYAPGPPSEAKNPK